jgi:predicted TIM-barrel fold metal-dependent hydrolase
VKFLAKQRFTRWLANFFQFLNPLWHNVISRFIKIGSLESEELIFHELRRFYPSRTRFVLLPMDMEVMGSGPTLQSYDEQHEKLFELKEKYGEIVYPFVAADPRRKEVLDCVKYYIEEKGFSGIKIYPALGYFPYDERLRFVWEYAQKYSLPVMTHTSHGGPYYRNRLTEKDFANSRIGKIPVKGKSNHKLTAYFTHPANYRYLLADYPRLKICLAHCGGAPEWDRYLEDPSPKGIPEIDKDWLTLCIDLMQEFPTLYTDISSTLYTKRFISVLRVLLRDKDIRKKILFGSDFYMVEFEGKEKAFSFDVRGLLDEDEFVQIAETNPKKFLASRIKR